ncbi:ATP-binding protein [Hymenobacter seoulensis]
MKKILLIDDNEQDRELYKRFLKRQPGSSEQFIIQEATSGEEGLALFQSVRPDCVLLDYNLLDTDGLAVLAELQQLTPPDTLCVVMITGGGSETLAVRVLNGGALDYLVKQQFDRELLYKTVVHAIEKNEWRQHVAQHHQQLQQVNQQLRESLAALTETRQQIQHANGQLQAANEEIQAHNQKLDTTNQQLARTNADLDNFVYAASHDLRQPIHNLRGLFEELRRSAKFDDPEEELLLRLVDDSLRSITTTITDLAAVVQEGRLPSDQHTERVDLASLTTEVLQSLRPELLAAQANVTTHFEALPEVSYIRSNLRTILLNLISNALKYRHPERALRLQVCSGLVHGQPVLSIQDNGLGLDLERYGKELFQLFRRFHPQAGEGTGVGLFLVNRLVQAQGGRIEVESETNTGTTFHLYLQS